MLKCYNFFDTISNGERNLGYRISDDKYPQVHSGYGKTFDEAYDNFTANYRWYYNCMIEHGATFEKQRKEYLDSLKNGGLL